MYVVAWFLCPQWDVKDPRRMDVRYASLGTARTHLSRQAAKLSKDEVHISAYVLDASFREPIGKRKRSVSRVAKP
jgi:hypothetical protein